LFVIKTTFNIKYSIFYYCNCNSKERTKIPYRNTAWMSIIFCKKIDDSAAWYSTHTCLMLLRFNGEIVFSYKKFLLFMRPIHVCRFRTSAGIWCAHFPSVIATIMDHKVQLLKPLNLRNLYTTLQNLFFSRFWDIPIFTLKTTVLSISPFRIID
jgi:hypothetical protein